MARMIDQIRASKLPSNMMQFAARGALAVGPEENLEILVYLATHNKIFGDLAKMTLAGWDEKASVTAASDPGTVPEVLNYLASPENLRPKLLPALLENPSVPEEYLTKLAISASAENIATMLKSSRVKSTRGILETLRANPYLKAELAATVADLLDDGKKSALVETIHATAPMVAPGIDAPAGDVDASPIATPSKAESSAEAAAVEEQAKPTDDQVVSAYLTEHAAEISADADKPFHPIGGIVDLLGADYFPVSTVQSIAEIVEKPQTAPATAVAAAASQQVPAAAAAPPVRLNTMQKINGLDVKGRIQLALKGNKEERSILIRDGTKLVALAVLEAPKISDGEVEKFALQKNVLEAVLRQIPMKRRFMKNYIVVRNLVANPRTPLDLGLGLMKHLLAQDLKNISANKEVSETVRKLALKMYKQKLDAEKKK
jgi:hypothetical protein